MAGKSVFEFSDYKAYLQAKIEAMPRRGHGFRAELAEAIGCQKTFVSQVLQGDAHFNLEYGEKINGVLKHDKEEAHFFLVMLQLARAGTPSLRQYFRDQMNLVVERRLQLKNRLKSEREMTAEAKSRHYSSWIYGAVHVATTIPSLQTRSAIAQRLSISEERVQEALLFLEEAGLVERKGDRFTPAHFHIHLGHDSDLITRHHTNWRLRTLEAIANPHREDLHYSAVVSLSADDALKLRAMMVEFLERTRAVVEKSPEEKIYTIAADLFEL